MKKVYALTEKEILDQLETTPQGLTTAQAEERRKIHGLNKLDEPPKVTLLQRFLQQLKDPMLIILMIAAVVSAATTVMHNIQNPENPEGLAEVFIILIVVLLNAILGVVQESKAEAAIEALQTMTAATCKVLRDGKQVVLHSDELVPGDIVILEAGDSVPADGRILESASLKIEEAALTGESVPVNKVAEALKLDGDKEIPLGDRKNLCFMGSTVVYGRGKAVIMDTGMKTQMGKIANALAATVQEQTPLLKKRDELG